MTINQSQQSPSQTSVILSTQPAVDEVDPHAYLRLRMRVIGGQHKVLGTVETLERDSTTGRLTAITVRHGMFRNKRTSVPAQQVKWVNADSVVLQLTRTNFMKLSTTQKG